MANSKKKGGSNNANSGGNAKKRLKAKTPNTQTSRLANAGKHPLGVVSTKYFDFEGLLLETGKTLSPVRLAYQTYGKLNAGKSNAVLLFHALSGDAHAAGVHPKTGKLGWYDLAVGPGKPFDTEKYFIICANVIGGCKGSTGPSSKNRCTNTPYALDFPQITLGDMVNAQKKLLDALGIEKLFCVTGASMGGMQALEWITRFKESAHCAILLECPAKQSPMAISFHHVGRELIMKDPNWQNGNYYGNAGPKDGLSLARQISHITYLSGGTFEKKFERKKSQRKIGRKFGRKYEVQNYLDYNGKKFVKRFDANSYLYITQAIDDFDLTRENSRELTQVFEGVTAKCLVVSVSSDWLYPPQQVQKLHQAMAQAGVDAQYLEISAPYGHDTFLVKNNCLGNAIAGFLAKAENTTTANQ